MAPPNLTDFSVLSFDCYGTLIDWQTGMAALFQPLTAQLPPSHPYRSPSSPFAIIKAFAAEEEPLCLTHPTLPYPDLLALAYKNLASTLHLPPPSDAEAHNFGASVPSWSAFPDSVPALQRLSKRFKLAILSNVDNDSFAGTNAGPLEGFKFDAVYTAQDIGSYKPSHKNFEYLLNRVEKDFGVTKEKLLHVGVGLKADHVPAKEFGIAAVWISRRRDEETLKEVEGKVGFAWEFKDMKSFADAVDEEASRLEKST